MSRSDKTASRKRQTASTASTAAGRTARTMAELAAIAGVSAITVSRALAGSPLVNASTAERIKALAEAHGYAFNVSARNLRLRRSMTVAVVVEMKPSAERRMSGPYPLELLGGIMQELTTAGYSVLLTSLHEAPLPNVRASDCVILLGQGPREEAMLAVRRWGRPMVVWGAVSRHGPEAVVGSDNRSGGALAAKRFLQLQRRTPVLLGSRMHSEFAERFDGFIDAFALAGVVSELIETDGLTVQAGSEAVRKRLLSGAPFDALFAASDLLAIGALQAIREYGRDVPADVSVIGFDDTPMGATYVPALSSIHQDFAQAGVLLARKALDLIDGGAAQSETLPTRLVVRAT